MKLVGLVVCIIVVGCSHPGALVTEGKEAWINVGGVKNQVFYCTAEKKAEPICYAPTLVYPRVPSMLQRDVDVKSNAQ